jgi:hypothetical protein
MSLPAETRSTLMGVLVEELDDELTCRDKADNNGGAGGGGLHQHGDKDANHDAHHGILHSDDTFNGQLHEAKARSTDTDIIYTLCRP